MKAKKLKIAITKDQFGVPHPDAVAVIQSANIGSDPSGLAFNESDKTQTYNAPTFYLSYRVISYHNEACFNDLNVSYQEVQDNTKASYFRVPITVAEVAELNTAKKLEDKALAHFKDKILPGIGSLVS